MNKRQLAPYEAFVRVVRCVHRHPALLEAAQHSTALALLEEVIAGMEGAEQTKLVSESMSKELTTQLDGASDLLKHMLSGLVNAAVLAGIQTRTSGQVFREPTDGAPPRVRVAMARAAADLAVRHEAALRQNGLPPNFIAELRAAADVVETMLGDGIDTAAAKTNVRHTWPKLIERGWAFVDVLEAQLEPRFVGGMAAEFAEARAQGRVHRPKVEKPAAIAAPQVALIGSTATRPIEIGAPDAGTNQLSVWSAIMQFFARAIRRRQSVPVIDAEYTIEEVTRLPGPDETRS